MADEERSARLSGGQRLAVGVSVLLGLGLAAYGVAGSYKTVSALAAKRGVPLAPLVPVGIDGGLIGVIVLDLVLSWTGHPIGGLAGQAGTGPDSCCAVAASSLVDLADVAAHGAVAGERLPRGHGGRAGTAPRDGAPACLLREKVEAACAAGPSVDAAVRHACARHCRQRASGRLDGQIRHRTRHCGG